LTEHLARHCVAGNRACLRCAASWYCEGDGNKLACGRCDPPQSNSTCGRSPTEHSFGYRAECEPCPVGWVGVTCSTYCWTLCRCNLQYNLCCSSMEAFYGE